MASKTNIINFIRKKCFDDKIKKLNKNVNSNKTKHVLVENELNKLSKNVEAVPTKGLTKNSINKFSILNGS